MTLVPRCSPFRFAYGKGTGPVGHPFVALTLVPGPGLHPDRLAGHKSRIEADAELTDKTDIFFGRLDQFSEIGVGTGMGNGAQIMFQFTLWSYRCRCR